MSLSITTSPERILFRGSVREPSLFRLRNGELLMTFHVTPDVHFAKRKAVRSRDMGMTWEDDIPRAHREQACGEGDGGEVFAPDIYTFEQSPGSFLGTAFRSNDGGITFSGPEDVLIRMDRVQTIEYPIRKHFPVPGHPLGHFYIDLPDYYTDVTKRASRRMGLIFWRYILESDCRWVTVMQGRFHGDRCYRAVLVESLDNGRTWDFVSTVAYNHEEQLDGFCEPALAWCRDGSLLCVLRRGGGLPLAQVRSMDGGRTWSKPRYLEAHGVDPDLVLLSNGVLACSYGRPGRHLMFSKDGCGHSWGYPTDLNASEGSSYAGLAEIDEARILVVYDDRLPNAPNVPRLDADGQYNPEWSNQAYIGARVITVEVVG